jgi:hypothetical protein
MMAEMAVIPGQAAAVIREIAAGEIVAGGKVASAGAKVAGADVARDNAAIAAEATGRVKAATAAKITSTCATTTHAATEMTPATASTTMVLGVCNRWKRERAQRQRGCQTKEDFSHDCTPVVSPSCLEEIRREPGAGCFSFQQFIRNRGFVFREFRCEQGVMAAAEYNAATLRFA